MARKKKKCIDKDEQQRVEDRYRDEIIRKLSILRKAKALVVGSNAVLRALEKNSLKIVVLISASPPLFHSINLLCKHNNVFLLLLKKDQVKDTNIASHKFTTLGVKTSSFVEDKEFEQLVSPLNALSSNVASGSGTVQICDTLEKSVNCADISENSFVVPKESEDYPYRFLKQEPVSKNKNEPKGAESFLSLITDSKLDFEFPDYVGFINTNNITINIKENEQLSFSVDC